MEFNDDNIVPIKKATFVKKNELKKQSKKIIGKFDELDGKYEGSSEKKKIVKEEQNFTPPVKTKEKDYDVHDYVKGLLEKYESELERDFTALENAYGKIIDWGDIDTDELVEKRG